MSDQESNDEDSAAQVLLLRCGACGQICCGVACVCISWRIIPFLYFRRTFGRQVLWRQPLFAHMAVVIVKSVMCLAFAVASWDTMSFYPVLVVVPQITMTIIG